jgi:hypothetical protein
MSIFELPFLLFKKTGLEMVKRMAENIKIVIDRSEL